METVTHGVTALKAADRDTCRGFRGLSEAVPEGIVTLFLGFGFLADLELTCPTRGPRPRTA